MTDQKTTRTSPEAFADLPLQPTGSGVADLEIAYEQMELAQDADPERAWTDGRVVDGADVMPSDRDDNGADSEAHPN